MNCPQSGPVAKTKMNEWTNERPNKQMNKWMNYF